MKSNYSGRALQNLITSYNKKYPKELVQILKNIDAADSLSLDIIMSVITNLMKSGKVFSSSELTIIISELSRKNYSPTEVFRCEWEKCSIDILYNFTAPELTSSFHALGTLKLKPYVEFMRAWRKEAITKMENGEFNISDFRNTAYAFSLLKMKPPSNFNEAWKNSVISKIFSFSQIDIVDILRSTVKLDIYPTPDLIFPLEIKAISCLKIFTPKNISVLLKAYSDLKLSPSPALLEALETEIIDKVATFSSKDLIVSFCAFGDLGVALTPKTLSLLENNMLVKIKMLSPRNLADLICSYSKLNIKPPFKFLATWEHHAIIAMSKLTPHNLTNVFHAFYKLEISPSLKFLSSWETATADNIDDFDTQDLITCAYSLSLMQRVIPSLLKININNLDFNNLRQEAVLRQLWIAIEAEKIYFGTDLLDKKNYDKVKIKLDPSEIEQIAKLVFKTKKIDHISPDDSVEIKDVSEALQVESTLAQAIDNPASSRDDEKIIIQETNSAIGDFLNDGHESNGDPKFNAKFLAKLGCPVTQHPQHIVSKQDTLENLSKLQEIVDDEKIPSEFKTPQRISKAKKAIPYYMESQYFKPLGITLSGLDLYDISYQVNDLTPEFSDPD